MRAACEVGPTRYPVGVSLVGVSQPEGGYRTVTVTGRAAESVMSTVLDLLDCGLWRDATRHTHPPFKLRLLSIDGAVHKDHSVYLLSAVRLSGRLGKRNGRATRAFTPV